MLPLSIDVSCELTSYLVGKLGHSHYGIYSDKEQWTTALLLLAVAEPPGWRVVGEDCRLAHWGGAQKEKNSLQGCWIHREKFSC